jgi:prepilin-type processing-associated H-X9-DG protein
MSQRCLDDRPVRTRTDYVAAMIIATIALSLALPTQQFARETTAKNSCTDRLRLIGKAVDQFERVQGYYPDAWYHPGDPSGSTTYGGWCTELLPYLEHEDLARRYHRDRPWWHESNQAVVNEQVPELVCPMSPVPHMRKGLKAVGSAEEFPELTMAVGDYMILRGYLDYAAAPPPVDNRVPGMLMGLTDPGARDQAVGIRPRRAMVTDGLSHTAMIGERAGRPGYWVRGKQEADFNTMFAFDGGWASYQSVWPRTFEDDGKTIVTSGVGPKTINCNNGFGVYAFHPGGANVVFGDGSVRFLNENVNSYVFLALLSRERGEVLDLSDYESR